MLGWGMKIAEFVTIAGVIALGLSAFFLFTKNPAEIFGPFTIASSIIVGAGVLACSQRD